MLAEADLAKLLPYCGRLHWSEWAVKAAAWTLDLLDANNYAQDVALSRVNATESGDDAVTPETD